MDGFPTYPTIPPTTVTMGSLISTILQMKSQMDFMDQFLTLYVPEYVQLKNYVIETQQQQQQPGMASVPPSTTASFPTSISAPASFYEAGTSTFTAPSTAKPYLGHQVVTTSKIGPPGKSKVRRKQTLVKKPTTSSPSAVKRRGRKRKYPIPSEGTAMENCQTILPTTLQSSDGIIKPCGPSQTVSSEQKKGKISRQDQNGAKVMSSLDILAAVSYVLKHKDKGNVSEVREAPSDPTASAVANVDQQQLHPEHVTYSSGISGAHSESQSSRYNPVGPGDFNNNNQQEFCGFSEGQVDPQQSLPHAQHHQQYKTASDQFQTNNVNPQMQSLTSSVTSNNISALSDNLEGYATIFEFDRSPQQEVIV